MGKLLQRLKDPKRSGVYRSARVDEIADAVKGTNIEVVRIAADRKSSLMQAMAKALQFPGWFGANWDALEDCLTDLSWREASGRVLVFEGAPALAADERGTLIDVLSSAAEFWREQGAPFFAVFIDPEHELELPELFRPA